MSGRVIGYRSIEEKDGFDLKGWPIIRQTNWYWKAFHPMVQATRLSNGSVAERVVIRGRIQRLDHNKYTPHQGNRERLRRLRQRQ